MAAEIRWSDRATEDFHEVIDYLLNNWSEEIALRFIEIVEYRLHQVSLQPKIGLLSIRDKGVRSVVITKHNKLYYRMLDEQLIEVASIFDTRQKPDRNPWV
jgi:plasmid stabilization system protein ParE